MLWQDVLSDLGDRVKPKKCRTLQGATVCWTQWGTNE